MTINKLYGMFINTSISTVISLFKLDGNKYSLFWKGNFPNMPDEYKNKEVKLFSYLPNDTMAIITD